MTWLDAPEVECVHVMCDGGHCQYQPPALGPDLPVCIIAVDGSVWSRFGGSLYYSPEPGGSRYGRIASPGDIVRAYNGDGPAWRSADFPVGQWRDGHLPATAEEQATHEAWQATIRDARVGASS